MDACTGFQRALDLIERELDGEISLESAACTAGMTAYHFKKMFSMLTGMTVGDYIRARRLTLAAADIRRGMKVIDAGMKYGYDSPDSFARAFARFHGMPPSEARASDARLNFCSPLHIKISLEGGTMLDYRIVERPAGKLLGYHVKFEGAPYGEKRALQEEKLFVTTRAKQWLLRGMGDQPFEDIVAVTDVTDEGYTFWYCTQADEWTLAHLYDENVTGITNMENFGFETLDVPAGVYAVFKTERERIPVDAYEALRERIAGEWLPGSGYTLRNAPEFAVYHWYRKEQRNSRYIEIWLPVEK